MKELRGQPLSRRKVGIPNLSGKCEEICQEGK